MPDLFRGSPFAPFFAEPYPPSGAPARPEVVAAGSGFAIAGDGLIVTNNHVVEDALRITVRDSEGREYPARLLGADQKTDIAVLRIAGRDPLPALGWGDSDAARVGSRSSRWALRSASAAR